MKKVKSSIKRKLAEHLVDKTLEKLDRWALRELSVMSKNSAYPIIFQTGKRTFIVGAHEIEHIGEHCYRVNYDGRLIHDFYSQKAATLYCVCFKLGLSELSLEMLRLDQSLSKAEADFHIYAAKLKTINKDTDDFKRQLWITRYSVAKDAVKIAREDLKKTLGSAKYIKVWDRII
jgi:hypothetical protein